MPNPERAVIAVNGPAVREMRKHVGITPARLAAEIDVSVEYMRKIELGHSRTVSPEVYDRLCYALRLVDRRVLLADPHGSTTPSPGDHPMPITTPSAPSALDAPDPIDDALDAPDPVDNALDAADPDGDRTSLLESVAS
jgi:transcriptional regulator with XRE-family HTH domain